MKRILHYITLAALGATSSYTLPMQWMMGGLDFSTIAGTYKQSFGRYAPAATVGAAIYGAWHACTSTAQRPKPLTEKGNTEIEVIQEQLCYATKKRPVINRLKSEPSFLITTKCLHISNSDCSWYTSRAKNQSQDNPQPFVAATQKKSHGASKDNYQYTVSLPESVRSHCLKLIESSETLTTEQIKESINEYNYPKTLTGVITSEITRLRLGKTDKSIADLQQELSAAQKKLSDKNSANLNQYYYNQYISPCLTGAMMGIVTRALYSRYPRATTAFVAANVMSTAYNWSRAQNNQG